MMAANKKEKRSKKAKTMNPVVRDFKFQTPESPEEIVGIWSLIALSKIAMQKAININVPPTLLFPANSKKCIFLFTEKGNMLPELSDSAPNSPNEATNQANIIK